jgi:hypothetical protein
MDYYVDRILAGGDPELVKGSIVKHIVRCAHCRSQLETKLDERERRVDVEAPDIHFMNERDAGGKEP